MHISFRSAKENDYKFLWNLHKVTMKEYVEETWGWDQEFQRSYFDDHFDSKTIQIVEVENNDIGAIEVQIKEDEIYISNMKIVPKLQNKGIGGTILKKIIQSSLKQQKPIRLQVLKVNPAQNLYRRLGFEVAGKTETHLVMRKEFGSK